MQNVFEILPSAISFQTDSVVDKCVNCIAKNYNFMNADQDYNFLPLAIFKQLLQVRLVGLHTCSQVPYSTPTLP